MPAELTARARYRWAGGCGKRGGGRPAYHVGGSADAPPMVLLHALGERGSNWPPVLTRLAEPFRVVAPDLRGHGGPDSHIPQDKLAAVAARIPACDLVTIPAGHHVHSARPAEFATAVLTWLPA